MKIIVPTIGNLNRLHTVKALAEVPCILVVHNKYTKDALHSDIDSEIVVSGTKTLVEKRNWILDNLVAKDEWFIGMDDNIQMFTAVKKPYRHKEENDTVGLPPKKFKSWRHVYNSQVIPQEWLIDFRHSIERAKKEGAKLVGVATMENPYFRGRRYSNYRFVKTKAFAMQNCGLRFEHEMCHDSFLSASAVAQHGRVLVDSFLHHKSTMYEPGGLGNRAEREAKGLLTQMQDICDKFPGLVVPGKGGNTALKFRLVTRTGVDRWRKENGYV